MLKKLVKYGNSNALVLDKAILELLNIPEGAVLKIRTDGKSITLTPHQEHVIEKINPNISAQETFQRAIMNERLKQFPNLDATQRTALAQKWVDLLELFLTTHDKLVQIPAYQKEVQEALAQGASKDTQTWVPIHEAIMEKHMPELIQLKKSLISFDIDNNLMPAEQLPTIETNYNEMRKTFADIFRKHNPAVFAQALQSPEYQHEAQLIAEKYEGNQHSAECIEEMKQLMYKFCPEMEQVHNEVADVTKKYEPVNK